MKYESSASTTHVRPELRANSRLLLADAAGSFAFQDVLNSSAFATVPLSTPSRPIKMVMRKWLAAPVSLLKIRRPAVLLRVRSIVVVRMTGFEPVPLTFTLTNRSGDLKASVFAEPTSCTCYSILPMIPRSDTGCKRRPLPIPHPIGAARPSSQISALREPSVVP